MADGGRNAEENSFWKSYIMPIPGRPSPKKVSNVSGNSSFQNFKNSVDDVWDCGVTDNEFGGATTPDVSICKTIAESAALNVINSHKSKVETKPKVEKPLRDVECNGINRLAKFNHLLKRNVLELDELKKLSWSGVPAEMRPDTWRLLAGYLPANAERRTETLERKRSNYLNCVEQYYNADWDASYQEIYRQIHIDVPRMSPLITLFQQRIVQEIFERILFIWAIRHPASGYVQGMNDLVTPFFIVFLQEVLKDGEDYTNVDVSRIHDSILKNVEADSFWCLSKFLDTIQDNYIFAQLGIQQKVNQLKELIKRIDETLHKHLQQHDIDYLQFSFRWMNNLLTRELPLRCAIRLWDTYLAECDAFATFQLYVCAAFLLNWREDLLRQKDFQSLMLMLQNLPTQQWTDAEIGVLVADAYRLKFMFADAPNHLQATNVRNG